MAGLTKSFNSSFHAIAFSGFTVEYGVGCLHDGSEGCYSQHGGVLVVVRKGWDLVCHGPKPYLGTIGDVFDEDCDCTLLCYVIC